jgi:hypothetical protein
MEKFIVILIVLSIIFLVILHLITRYRIKFLEKVVEKTKKQLNLLLVLLNYNDDSEKELIDVIKKNQIKDELCGSYLELCLNYYENKIKKWDTEKIGRHLVYMNAELLEEETLNCLKFLLGCAFVNNILLSVKITTESIDISNYDFDNKKLLEEKYFFIEETKKFVFSSFIEKNTNLFLPFLTKNPQNCDDFQDPQVKSFLLKLREIIYSSSLNEKEIAKKIGEIELLFLCE